MHDSLHKWSRREKGQLLILLFKRLGCLLQNRLWSSQYLNEDFLYIQHLTQTCIFVSLCLNNHFYHMLSLKTCVTESTYSYNMYCESVCTCVSLWLSIIGFVNYFYIPPLHALFVLRQKKKKYSFHLL